MLDSGRRRAAVARRHDVLVLLVGLLGSALFLAVTYAPYDYHHLTGDDLILYLAAHSPGGYASSFWNSFTQTGGGKFRPAVAPLLSLAAHHLGTDFQIWVRANIALLSIDGALLGYLAWRLSRRSTLVAALTVAAALFSRFSGYFVLQGFGIMESTALFWFLVTLLIVLEAWERRSSGWLTATSATYLLTFLSHERYVVVGGFLICLAALAPWSMARRTRAALVALPITMVAVNYLVKTWALHVSFFQGGGGGNSHSAAEVIGFFIGGGMNTVGYNGGDGNQSGLNSLDIGGRGFVIMALFFLPTLALALYTTVNRSRVPYFSRKVFLVLSLYGPLLLSASIQVRQEWRWLFGPFVVILLGIAWAAGRMPARSRMAVLPLVALLGSLGVDAYYRPYLDLNYYNVAQATVDRIYDDVVVAHRYEIDTRPVVFVYNRQRAYRHWYLHEGGFFDVYSPGHAPILFARNKSDVPGVAAANPDALIFDLKDRRVIPRQDLGR